MTPCPKCVLGILDFLGWCDDCGSGPPAVRKEPEEISPSLLEQHASEERDPTRIVDGLRVGGW